MLQGVYAMGYNTPSKIQETALPTLIADPPQNMIAQSQSGTGKTAGENPLLLISKEQNLMRSSSSFYSSNVDSC